jgi:4-hydroxythreonine-4-phosphate dehydrogenase
MMPVLVSSGEPAGIGPDLCISLAQYELPLVVLGCPVVLKERARQLNQEIVFLEYQSGKANSFKPGSLTFIPVTCPSPVEPGQLNGDNASYVIELLKLGASLCEQGNFSALVTAPVHKAIINKANIPFTGHTEFLSEYFKAQQVVMLLACPKMKVALVTTHLPLRQVPDTITSNLVMNVITQLHHSLIHDFGIVSPLIKVAGLNPHAGESGYLGWEEIEIITPAIAYLQEQGMKVQGPYPADTLFISTQLDTCDAFVAMYHDQGLPILKHIGFNEAVNITLGLPIIRTSVDHGTALDLAGKGIADSGSMLAAVELAMNMALNRINGCHK